MLYQKTLNTVSKYSRTNYSETASLQITQNPKIFITVETNQLKYQTPQGSTPPADLIQTRPIKTSRLRESRAKVTCCFRRTAVTPSTQSPGFLSPTTDTGRSPRQTDRPIQSPLTTCRGNSGPILQSSPNPQGALYMKNTGCSWQNPRCPHWSPRGGEKLRGGGKGGKYTFSFSFFFQNQWDGFQS